MHFPLVPIMYPMCPCEFFQVPTLFPKSFPIAPHFYKLKRWAIGSTYVFIFQLGDQTGAFYWGVPSVLKKIGDGPINMTPFKKKTTKMCEHTHELI